ncbi:MAG: LPS export ABC transporter periplasmic protein LptC [Chitinispirillales bacterium]|jgi:hypothetical protein|nr:LPS export ABC transporter periplasmic protein LptC [Chitinispirillales bacterium]
MKIRQILSLIIVSIVVCVFHVCGPRKDTIPVDDGLITAPQQRLNTAQLFFYEHGILRWRLDTDYMERPLSDTGNIFVVPVDITVYDTLGNLSTRIVSDSGTSSSQMEIFDLWGNVHIENEDGSIVKSDKLRWTRNLRPSARTRPGAETFDLWGNVYIENEDGMIVRSEQLRWLRGQKRITSETFVQVETTKGDILRGKGLDAIDDFSRFSFKAEVSGRFPDFRQRMEEGDEDFFR